jgi:hypothetical protein
VQIKHTVIGSSSVAPLSATYRLRVLGVLGVLGVLRVLGMLGGLRVLRIGLRVPGMLRRRGGVHVAVLGALAAVLAATVVTVAGCKGADAQQQHTWPCWDVNMSLTVQLVAAILWLLPAMSKPAAGVIGLTLQQRSCVCILLQHGLLLRVASGLKP